MSWLCFPLAWPSSQSSHQYFAFNPHIQVGFCLIVRSQNYTNLPDSWICGRLRVFAGVLRIFAGVLRVILGAVFCIYMRRCSGYENVLVLYVPGTQPGCKPCSVIFKMSLVVIVWPLGSKTRQTSRSRRDSENWVILGHTPKQPKIIDRRNVQVGWASTSVSLATGSIDMPMLSHEGKSERAIDGNTAAAHVAYALSHPAASPASEVWQLGFGWCFMW